MSKLDSTAKIVTVCALMATLATRALALPVEPPPKNGNLPSSLPAWINTTCPAQCAKATGAAFETPKWLACVWQCGRTNVSFQPWTGPSIAASGITNCDWTEAGDVAWYSFCQVDWGIIMGAGTDAVAAALGGLIGSTQAASALVNAAGSFASPCGYIYGQLNSQFQYFCPGQSLPNMP